MQNKEEFSFSDATEIYKSNVLISSKQRLSLFGQKLIAMGLYKIQTMDTSEIPEKGNIVCEITVNEIRAMMDRAGNGLYHDLNDVSKRFIEWRFGYQDPERNEFSYVNLMTRIEYRNGLLTMVFNGELRNYLVNLRDNYTILYLPVLLKLKRTYSFRLYELLLGHANSFQQTEGERSYEVTYNLAELQFMLGLFDINDPTVVSILKNTENPDYDEAIRVLTKQRDGSRAKVRWYDFWRAYLMPAVQELNETPETDMQIDDVQPGKKEKGRGTAIDRVTFRYRMHLDGSDGIEKRQLTEDDKFRIESELFTSLRLPIQDVRTLCRFTNYDIERIQSVARIVLESGEVLQGRETVTKILHYLKATERDGVFDSVTGSNNRLVNPLDDYHTVDTASLRIRKSKPDKAFGQPKTWQDKLVDCVFHREIELKPQNLDAVDYCIRQLPERYQKVLYGRLREERSVHNMKELIGGVSVNENLKRAIRTLSNAKYFCIISNGIEEGCRINREILLCISEKLRHHKYNFTLDEMEYLRISTSPLPIRTINTLARNRVRYFHEFLSCDDPCRLKGIGEGQIEAVYDYMRQEFFLSDVVFPNEKAEVGKEKNV